MSVLTWTDPVTRAIHITIELTWKEQVGFPQFRELKRALDDLAAFLAEPEANRVG